MSNTATQKPRTKEEILSDKKKEYNTIQYAIQDILISSPQATEKISEHASRLAKLHFELGSHVQISETPGGHYDGHGNHAKSHIRTEGNKLVFSSIITTEHGDKKYYLIKAGGEGKAEISEDKAVVNQIFENPHKKDISGIESLIRPAEIDIVNVPSPELDREHLKDLREFFGRN